MGVVESESPNPVPSLARSTGAGTARGTIFACALAGLALSACGVQTRATSPRSPGQLLGAALSNGNARGSVHVRESAQVADRTITFSDDVATHAGRQEITLSTGVHAHVLIVGARAYVSGNRAALIRYFGFSTSAAGEIGSRWVSIPASSRSYAVVAADATLPSQLSAFALTGALSETAPTTINGRSLIGIKGNIPASGPTPSAGTATVYLSRTREPLPVAATYSFSNGQSAEVEFSGWGDGLALTPPPNVINERGLGR